MNKKSVLITVVMVFLFGSAVYGQPWDGNGVDGDPYQIWDANDMQAIGAEPDYWGAYFLLMADIDLSAYTGTSFNVIGDDVNAFTGVFDGNGHTISNFTYDSDGINYIGLFRYVNGASAEIRDLGLIEPDVSAGTSRYTGSLVGRLQAGDVFDCYMENGRVAGDIDVGGLLGYNYKNDISGCYSTGSAIGGDHVGGLIGTNGNGTMTDCYSGCDVSGGGDVGGLGGINGGELIRCYAAGSVVGTGSYAGGLVGLNINGTVSNSYSSGGVTGGSMVGGLLGQNYNGVVSHCYSTSLVGGNIPRGGLIGYDNTGTYSSSFWDSDVNPDVNGIGNTTDLNVVGLPTVLMQTESTYTDAGWDFVGETANGTEDIWDICEGTNYPKLVWSIPAGDFICPDGVNMFDFAVLGDAWMSAVGDLNWDAGCDISEPNDEVIDGLDLGVFVGNWLVN